MSTKLFKHISNKNRIIKYMSTVNNERPIKVIFNKANGEKITTEGKKGDSLLDVIVNNNLDFDGYGACEGTLTCSTCHVILNQKDYDALPEKPSDEELDMLDLAYNLTDTSRLGCQIILEEKLDGLEVQVPATVNDASDNIKHANVISSFLSFPFSDVSFETLTNFFKSVFTLIVSYLVRYSKNIDVEILYKSNDYIIVNKPEDVFINNHNKKRPSLDLMLRKKYPRLVNNNVEHGFYFVHRLDYVTSGVLCLALNKQACAAASKAMQRKISRKYYLALLRGHVSVDSMNLTDFIGYCSKEIDGNHKMCSPDSTSCIKPRNAHTKLVVLERGVYMSYPATKVLLLLITGRRHQIRVHCSNIGHTIVGDYTYSDRRDTCPSRTFLHSYRLELGIENIKLQTNDPFTSKKLHGSWIPVEFVNEMNGTFLELFG